MYGNHKLWHADDDIGMTVVAKDVKIRAFPPLRRELTNAEDFKEVFTAV